MSWLNDTVSKVTKPVTKVLKKVTKPVFKPLHKVGRYANAHQKETIALTTLAVGGYYLLSAGAAAAVPVTATAGTGTAATAATATAATAATAGAATTSTASAIGAALVKEGVKKIATKKLTAYASGNAKAAATPAAPVAAGSKNNNIILPIIGGLGLLAAVALR